MNAIKHTVEEQTQQGRAKWEVADIFRQYGEAYRLKHGLPASHLKVMHDIEVCRTSYLGGHIEQCDSCGFERNAYNSCRNRHCPKCQALTKARWLEARKAELLPVVYFHNVFTLPHEINPIALCNKKVIFDILFKSVSETLLQFGRNPKNGLGGKLGFIAILHTWDQTLMDHFHLHCVIPSGCLSLDDSQWIAGRENFLFRVEPLSEVFQGKFIHYLEKAFEKGKLIFPGKTEPLGTSKGFKDLKNQLWAKNWVVYSKAPFAGPEQVLDYLGRYTHRVAISNHRIVEVKNCRPARHRSRSGEFPNSGTRKRAGSHFNIETASTTTHPSSWNLRQMSSFGASCSMSCPMVSCVFGILASWQTEGKRKISAGVVNSSGLLLT